jgi:predicted nucleotide-binding protein
MARKSIPNEPQVPAELLISREDAKTKLEDRIRKGRELKQVQITSDSAFESAKNEYNKWNSFNVELLNRIFSSDKFAKEYSRWGGAVSISYTESSLGEEITDLYKDIDEKLHRLDSIIERLELIPVSAVAAPAQISEKTDAASQRRSKKVFVVHGHDEVAKTNLEVFLNEIGLQPIVLHRQADEGLTVIEKFEKHSDVGYAFILLTPDDVAYLKADEAKNDKDRKKELRARPNVIFEFGYFVGKLGRSRVCCLYTGNVTLPSDVSGMIYKKFNASIDEVAYSIIKDLKASGYSVG